MGEGCKESRQTEKMKWLVSEMKKASKMIDGTGRHSQEEPVNHDQKVAIGHLRPDRESPGEN